jgi:hypothetical protein
MRFKNPSRHFSLVLATIFALITRSGSAAADPGDNLIASALSKLTAMELSALLSSPMSVALASIDGVDTRSGPSVDQVLAHFMALMERHKGPLRFIAADGTEFECYGEYVSYQWGGEGLGCD